MDRRLFFKNLIGVTAAAAIAPQLFTEITEHDYIVDGVSTPPDSIFDKGEGFWVFRNKKLIAWSSLHGVVANYEQEAIDVTGNPAFQSFEDELCGFRAYTQGRMNVSYNVENLHVENIVAFNKNELTQIICVMPDGLKIENEGIWTEYGIISCRDSETTASARFNLTGKAKITTA